MDLGLKGKKVIMNGGAHGLGLASLKHFAAEGADVAFFSRKHDKIDAARDAIAKSGNDKVCAELLDMAREADATRIFIGSENRLFALSGSAVIASPYRDRDGRVVGVVGVIGPTRLNYARLVPMVDFTAQSLGKLIG